MVPNDLSVAEAPAAVTPQLLHQDSLAEVQALLATCKAATAAAELERDKAAQASAAAITARAAAEADRDLAAKAKAAAEADRDLAAKAKAAAEAERDLAVQAKTATDAAKVAAEAERDQASQAKAPAIAAKAAVETERDLATQAKTATETAKTAAEADRDQAAKAKIAADEAKTGAEAALAQATTANTNANAAKVAAETERDQAVQAKTAAESAKAAAEAALEATTKAALAAQSEATRAAQAHNLSTTAGLSGAFNLKAIKASTRMNLWSLILVLSLGWAAFMGWIRYDDLKVLITAKAEASALIAQLSLALLSIGPPVWLAWMATKMISRNHTIGEDYDFKASLAKAYIGFKQEARGLDPIYEQRLFAAAITSLDANPVRFLSNAHPGTPFQELLQQPFMNEALKDPTFKQKFIEWMNSHFKKTPTTNNMTGT